MNLFFKNIYAIIQLVVIKTNELRYFSVVDEVGNRQIIVNLLLQVPHDDSNIIGC